MTDLVVVAVVLVAYIACEMCTKCCAPRRPGHGGEAVVQSSRPIRARTLARLPHYTFHVSRCHRHDGLDSAVVAKQSECAERLDGAATAALAAAAAAGRPAAPSVGEQPPDSTSGNLRQPSSAAVEDGGDSSSDEGSLHSSRSGPPHHVKLRGVHAGVTKHTCAVCLDDYEDGDEIRVLPCQHRFHQVCVDKWLLHASSACPVCQHDATVPLPEPRDCCNGGGSSTETTSYRRLQHSVRFLASRLGLSRAPVDEPLHAPLLVGHERDATVQPPPARAMRRQQQQQEQQEQQVVGTVVREVVGTVVREGTTALT